MLRISTSTASWHCRRPRTPERATPPGASGGARKCAAGDGAGFAGDRPLASARIHQRQERGMTRFSYDHIHLRSPDAEATARWYEQMFGAEIIRSVQSDGR